MTTTSIIIILLVCSLVSWSQSQEMRPPLQHGKPHFVGPGIEAGNRFAYDAQEPIDPMDRYETMLANCRHLFVQSLMNLNEICGLFDYLNGEPEDEEPLEEWPNAPNKPMRKRADSAKKKRSVPYDFVANVDPNIDLYDEALVTICRRMRRDDDLNLQKRAGKLVGTKVKFHSWGGKRNENGQQKDRSNPKIVVRTPFNSWGGKRSVHEMPNY